MSTPRPLILASTSPYRRALLERLGVPFEARSPGVDERAVTRTTPEGLAEALAVMKAEALHDVGDALVIGSDQVVDLDGEILGKPGTVEGAVEQLLRLAGRTHRLITAVAVHDARAARTEVATDVHTLTMRSLDRDTLARYVAYDQPLDCAGSYKLETRGIALFERIQADPETADQTAIIGLPLMKTLVLMLRLGVDVLAR